MSLTLMNNPKGAPKSEAPIQRAAISAYQTAVIPQQAIRNQPRRAWPGTCRAATSPRRATAHRAAASGHVSSPQMASTAPINATTTNTFAHESLATRTETNTVRPSRRRQTA